MVLLLYRVRSFKERKILVSEDGGCSAAIPHFSLHNEAVLPKAKCTDKFHERAKWI